VCGQDAEKARGIRPTRPKTPAPGPYSTETGEKVLEYHHLPSRLARFMNEDRISEISDTMDDPSLHPPS
jgi:hypothetical protein